MISKSWAVAVTTNLLRGSGPTLLTNLIFKQVLKKVLSSHRERKEMFDFIYLGSGSCVRSAKGPGAKK